jgi:hypothetical protein
MLRFVALHSSVCHAKRTLRVLNYLLWIEHSLLTMCATWAVGNSTRQVLCAWCGREWYAPKRGVRTGGSSCVTVFIKATMSAVTKQFRKQWILTAVKLACLTWDTWSTVRFRTIGWMWSYTSFVVYSSLKCGNWLCGGVGFKSFVRFKFILFQIPNPTEHKFWFK